jgi:L-ascorbate metabolism protein UlaG (beta-lactamase superfamily)
MTDTASVFSNFETLATDGLPEPSDGEVRFETHDHYDHFARKVLAHAPT